VPPARVEALIRRTGVFGPEIALIPDRAVVDPAPVIVPTAAGPRTGILVSGVSGGLVSGTGVLVSGVILVSRVKCATGVGLLGGRQQLIRLDRRDPEHDGQIFGPDAVPVHQVQNLLGGGRGIGQHLPASEGKQPCPQLARIMQQGLHRAHDRARQANRIVLPAGKGTAVVDELGTLSLENLAGRVGAPVPGGMDVRIPAPLVAVHLLGGNEQLARVSRGDPEHDGQILWPDAVPVHQVQDFPCHWRAARQDLGAGEGKQPRAQSLRIKQHGLRQVQHGVRNAGGVLLPARDGAAVSDELGTLGAERVEGGRAGLGISVGPLPPLLAIL